MGYPIPYIEVRHHRPRSKSKFYAVHNDGTLKEELALLGQDFNTKKEAFDSAALFMRWAHCNGAPEKIVSSDVTYIDRCPDWGDSISDYVSELGYKLK